MLHERPVIPTCALAAIGAPVFCVQLMLALLGAGLGEVNGFAAVAVTVTDPLTLTATAPTVHVIVPLLLLHEAPPAQLTKVKPAGSVSVIVTPVAPAVP